ncbi:hypothetical protein [uncultured Dysosmobacter sp.]|uniref:hypothetical protein n=1 Tax=uncultured Dysosmobacter sp. TaxID=2591384 RepID=UPI00262AB8BA|nr:hypothetical protein [uncultured Dysosmobacter sp.]
MGLLDEYARWRAKLIGDVDQVLLTHVAPAVKRTMREQVYEKVYEAYEPRVYVRRFDDGGMGDIENYEASVDSGKMTLTVENLTKDAGYWRPPGAGDRLLTPVIESGSGYDYFSPGARPFNGETEEAVVESGTAERELAAGLRALGYDVQEL